jgi:pyruvate kinase
VRAALIVVLTHGGSTARLVAKYRPSVPVLAVFVPTLTTDSVGTGRNRSKRPSTHLPTVVHRQRERERETEREREKRPPFVY